MVLPLGNGIAAMVVSSPDCLPSASRSVPDEGKVPSRRKP